MFSLSSVRIIGHMGLFCYYELYVLIKISFNSCININNSRSQMAKQGNLIKVNHVRTLHYLKLYPPKQPLPILFQSLVSQKIFDFLAFFCHLCRCCFCGYLFFGEREGGRGSVVVEVECDFGLLMDKNVKVWNHSSRVELSHWIHSITSTMFRKDDNFVESLGCGCTGLFEDSQCFDIFLNIGLSEQRDEIPS